MLRHTEGLLPEMIVQRHGTQLQFGEPPPPLRIVAQGALEGFDFDGRKGAVLVAHEAFEEFGIGHDEASCAIRCFTHSPRAR